MRGLDECDAVTASGPEGDGFRHSRRDIDRVRRVASLAGEEAHARPVETGCLPAQTVSPGLTAGARPRG